MEYWVEEREGKPPILMGKKNNGKRFSLQSQNPVEKVYRYREEIHELYCPRMNQKAGFSAITAGVIFPNASESRVQELFSPSMRYRGMDQYPNYYPISGEESVWNGFINRVFPASKRPNSFYMNDLLADDLRNWLIEPDFSSTQREPLELDKTQEKYVITRTDSGYRRIKGPAGSGKSLVLAARAAQLQSEGKDVLVISFNITLLNYLKDLAVRYRPSGKVRQGITWLYFHRWCKRVCQESDNK